MKLTWDQIEAGKSAKGGWTRKQLAEWGVPWPPPKGWKAKLIAGKHVKPAKPRFERYTTRPGNDWWNHLTKGE